MARKHRTARPPEPDPDLNPHKVQHLPGGAETVPPGTASPVSVRSRAEVVHDPVLPASPVHDLHRNSPGTGLHFAQKQWKGAGVQPRITRWEPVLWLAPRERPRRGGGHPP